MVAGEKRLVKDQLARKSCASLRPGDHIIAKEYLYTAKTLPAAQLFGERTVRAVGGIPETEVFVDLE